MQPQYILQQPGVTIVAAHRSEDDNKFSLSAKTQMKVLSIIQIVMGAVCMVFGMALTGVDAAHYGFVGYGIWIGAYFILVGAIGLGAVHSNTQCFIVSAMVLNIICSSLFWYVLLALSATSLGIASSGYRRDNGAVLGLNSLMLIMSLAELVITIWCAVLCCGAVCKCCKTTAHNRVVHYNATPALYNQQQTVVYPSALTGAAVYTTAQPYPLQGQQVAYTVPVPQQPPMYVAHPQSPPDYQPAPQGSTGYPQQTLTSDADSELPCKQ